MASASDVLTPEEIAKKILKDVKTVSLIEGCSACSVIFECTTSTNKVCMKVSFVHPPSSSNLSVDYNGLLKFTTTEVESEQTREKQHRMHDELIRYNSVLQFIPDAYGSCTLTPEIFNSYFNLTPPRGVQVDARARVHIDLIVQKAKENGLSIHILFMEFLIGVGGYNKKNAVHVSNTPDIVAAILAVVIVTGVISQDMHPDNVQIGINDVDGSVTGFKLIDWDRSISIYSDDLTGWIDLLVETPNLFILVCTCFPDETLITLIKSITIPTQWDELKDNLKTILKINFTTYHKYLSQRILELKSNHRSLTAERKIYDIFDLLTFIGFMDCVLKWARTRSSTMQFSPFIYNLFKHIEGIALHEYIDLNELLTLRKTYLECLKSVQPTHSTSLTGVVGVLNAISIKLDGFLVPSGSAGRGGRPRYLKRTHHNTIKKQQRNKNNRKSIKRIYRRSKIRKRNTRK
jgi:hypothetical protein